MAMLTRLAAIGATASIAPKALQRIIAYLSKSTKVDTMESFTNELVEKKNQEWAELRENLIKSERNGEGKTEPSFQQKVDLMAKGVIHDIQNLKSPQLGLDVRSLSQAQLDNLLLATLEVKNKVDFLYLVRQVLQYAQLPSGAVLVSCLKYLSSNGNLQLIQALAEICAEQPIVRIHAGLAPFKAIALWTNGNANAALDTLHLGYAQCISTDEGRRMVRTAFRSIAEETVTEKSEAVLVYLMNVAQAIYVEHNDIFVLGCIWKQCFASTHLCDQQTASNLLKQNEELRELVTRRASPLCKSFLNRNKVIEVYRLIEIFLQYKEPSACNCCLGLLFDYQYLRQDLSACAEIIKTCCELNMPLSSGQTEQFLALFIDQNDHVERSRSEVNLPPPATYQYKF